MKQWYSLLIPAMVLSLISPSVLRAADEAIEVMEDVMPTFQNAAQAQRAENLTAASFTEEDMEEARQQATEDATKEINTLAENYADGVVDEIASDYAYREVKQLSRNHALNSVDTEDFPNLDERATYYADKYVEEKAREYALSVADGDREKYQEAYEAALERANGSSFHNLWDTLYEEAISKALDEEAFSDWGDAYNSAYARATGGGDEWEDALQTAYNYATDRAQSAGIWEEAFDHAIKRATNPDFSNAYQAVYKKALEEAVTEINKGQLQDIYEMRYVYKLGWGKITKKLGLKEYHNGLGNMWKHQVGPSLEDEIIPPGPPEPAQLLLEKEIAKVTRRNSMIGWDDNQKFQAKGNKNKGSKKEYGLAQVSSIAGDEVRGKSPYRNGTKGSASDKSSVSDNKGKKGSVSSKSSSSNNGKKGSVSSKSSSTNNGKKGSVSSKSSTNNGNKGSVSSKNSSSNSGKKGGNSNNDNKGAKGKNK